ncbi:MAG TPA: 1-(5-phosphoribosyl)-5-((5-phosphoribosylamino)methylideneamino)imidazole-4-carboxamide isomerase [Chloroflexi bacterium]|nr:1-(5-phosphoribosyl)-5-((5-phosphoribosylamino)methylideneamino)imidazole-4-carboxamide isomerase [Chloroflexota bacterium]HBY07882.1 1-(5-phosphoribosyl)-5-((5-phosphoribosylamino)methylideneamino)imidazole-4-carboxamide isomerase [Chloroflexota bacterium]
MKPDTAFTIFPAIDLRAGKVVRLAQGDPARQTTYGDDPLYWAERWQAEGAEWLHVINLSGAFAEDANANWAALQSILTTGLHVEFGGGLRERDHLRAALDLGVARVFLGTAAIQNPALVDWAIAEYGPQHIAGDIGACDGQVMVKGWQQATPLTVLEVGQRLRDQGVAWCVLTDVKRDGVSIGVDVASAVVLQQTTGLQVVASGGVASLADVRRVWAAGLAGVIIGRALYEGELTISECRKVKAE